MTIILLKEMTPGMQYQLVLILTERGSLPKH